MADVNTIRSAAQSSAANIDAGLRAGRVDQVETFLSERLSQRAGHEDRFTATRFASLADARRIPAQ